MNKFLKSELEIPKTVLTIDELATYSNYQKSYIYQLVHKRQIPAHKPPLGRKLFFLKEEIDNWLLARKYETVTEIENNLFNKKK